MKTLIFILFAFPVFFFGQNIIDKKIEEYNHHLPIEKVYVQTNKTLFQPGETIYIKSYITNGNNEISTQSGLVHFQLITPAGTKLVEQTRLIDYGTSELSIDIPKEAKGGLYQLKAYTKWQQNFSDVLLYEKEITVQRVIAPRLLMKLEVEKEAYGEGDLVKANVSIRNLQDIPLKNLEFLYEATIDGGQILKQTAITDENGKATIQVQLPSKLSGEDGSLNVQFEYEGNKESIARNIPIFLDAIDLQFLPEGGYAIPNVLHQFAFKALNKYGNPADVKGEIVDEQGKRITSFESFHQGMGSVEFTMQNGKSYFAKITSPFQSKENIPLPKAENRSVALQVERLNQNKIKVNLYSTKTQSISLVGKTNTSIVYNENHTLNQGSNDFVIDTKKMPVGILEFTIFKENQPIAERLIFNQQTNGLNIEIKTDKSEYNTRERVNTKIKTTDRNGKVVRANLSVSVVNDKLISYLDDKQHNINSWLLAGSELTGEIYEPEFYFNPEKEKRFKAMDLLLLTQGWRYYKWEDVLNDQEIELKYFPENDKTIIGKVTKFKNRRKSNVPYPTTVYAVSNEILYVEETDEFGTFRFDFPEQPKKGVVLYAQKKPGEELEIVYQKIKKDTVFTIQRKSNKELELDLENLKEPEEKEKQEQTNKSEEKKKIAEDEFDEDWEEEGNVALEESVIVTGYNAKALSLSSSVVTASELSTTGNDISQALQGRVAGVQISNNAGFLGANSNITIRGVSSLSGSNNPLLVIDGFPVSGDAASINDISAFDVGSITVLKDAASTAIYGNRGANGVIIINTKSYNGYGNENLYNNLGKKTDLQTEHYYSNRPYYRYNQAPKQFYIPKYKSIITQNKEDYRSCIYWNYNVTTNENGEADFYFYNSDESTVFRIIAEGFDGNGLVGRKEHTYSTSDQVEIEVKFPLYATIGDRIDMPIWIKNNQSEIIDANVTEDLPSTLKALDFKRDLVLKPGEFKTKYVPLVVEYSRDKKSKLRANVLTDTFRQSSTKEVQVFERGFPVRFGQSTIGKSTFNVPSENVISRTQSAYFKIYLNPIQSIIDGVERILRQPSGCFEQVSSSTYPNIYALKLLNDSQIENRDEIEKQAKKYLKLGYKKLAAYEVKGGGFDWYGNPPAHEALTAFGLIEFTELKGYVSVDEKMIQRTKQWLISRKDSIGGYKQAEGRYAFRGDRYAINNAYINYALSFAGEQNIETQYQTSKSEATESKDIYRLALMALTAHQLGKKSDYYDLMKQLKHQVFGSGIIRTESEGSITHSYGNSLKNECLALYALAIMKESKLTTELHQVMQELVTNSSRGYYGSTQATGLSLNAIYQYNKLYNESAKEKGDKVLLKINDEIVIDKTMSEYLELGKDLKKNVFERNITKYLQSGENKVEMEVASSQLSFIDFSYWYKSTKPNNQKECKVRLNTELLKSKVSVAETTQLIVEVKNIKNEDIPMTIAQVGIPGGLSVEPKLLKDLLENEVVDYYEIKDNFLVFYWRGLKANETKRVNLTMKAEVPGTYTGVSSSAYLYYTEELKQWNKGLEVEVLP